MASLIRRRGAFPDSTPPKDPLIASGLLFEGNFQDWQERMNDRFIVEGRPDQAYPAISRADDGTITYHKSTFGDFEEILKAISPALAKRIPRDLDLSVGHIYAQLERLCQPFRLLDLPAELRNQVYEETVCRHPFQHIKGPLIRRDGVPALAQTTQQLRREVIPVYLSSNIFHVDMTAHRRDDFRPALQGWRDIVLGPSTKFLRTLNLEFFVERRVITRSGRRSLDYDQLIIRLAFSKEKGLSVHCPKDIETESKDMLEGHVRAVEMERKKEGMAGESLLMAIDRLEKQEPHSRVGWLDLKLKDKRVEDLVDTW